MIFVFIIAKARSCPGHYSFFLAVEEGALSAVRTRDAVMGSLGAAVKTLEGLCLGTGNDAMLQRNKLLLVPTEKGSSSQNTAELPITLV